MQVNRREMLSLKLRYGNLSREDIGDLLHAALRGRHGDALLSRMMLETGLALRPGIDSCAPDDMRWKYWAALAMRFFPALRPGGRASTVAAVRGWLEHDRVLTQALLFGEEALLEQVLSESFESRGWQAHLPGETQMQAMILDMVRYHLSSTNLSERQIGNWSAALLEEWSDELTDRLQIGLVRRMADVAERLVLRLSGGDRPADPAMFRVYMERFREAGPDWAYGQALGYHHELKSRYRRVSRSAGWVLLGGAAVCVAMAGVLVTRAVEASVGWRVVAASTAVLSLVVTGFHLARIAVVMARINETIGWQLRVLEEVADKHAIPK